MYLLSFLIFQCLSIQSYQNVYRISRGNTIKLMSTRGNNNNNVKNDEDIPVSTTTSTGATVLKCDKLTKAYTAVPQFDEISFSLGKGQRVGLIGINGAGKTTFLKCLARTDSADSGTVESLASANVVFVEQDPKWDATVVYEALFSENTARASAAKKYMAAMSPSQADPDTALLEAIDEMNAADAWVRLYIHVFSHLIFYTM